MFEISRKEGGGYICSGRLDAAQCDTAQEFLDGVTGIAVIDCSGLEYISSAGLGVLLKTQKRLMADGGGVHLAQVSNHIFDIFRYSGFDQIFQITKAED